MIFQNRYLGRYVYLDILKITFNWKKKNKENEDSYFFLKPCKETHIMTQKFLYTGQS